MKSTLVSFAFISLFLLLFLGSFGGFRDNLDDGVSASDGFDVGIVLGFGLIGMYLFVFLINISFVFNLLFLLILVLLLLSRLKDLQTSSVVHDIRIANNVI